MNHTQTYGLNQWEDNDRILRTDFNADNQKLESALGAKLQYHKLKEVVTQETATRVEVDVSDIHFADWKYLVGVLTPTSVGTCSWWYSPSGGTASKCSCNSMGNLGSDFVGLGRFYSSSSSLNSVYMIALILHNPAQYLRGITFGGTFVYGKSTTYTYEDLSVLVLSGTSDSDHIGAGAKIELWGVK